MSTIVIPVVKSAAGRRAFDIAKKKAIEEGATLVLVGTAKIDERLGENVEALREHIEELEKELATAGIEYRSEWFVGEPLSRATLDLVRDNDADLIVLGLRKRSPVGKALLGSFEQEILLDAPCPVLSVGTPLA